MFDEFVISFWLQRWDFAKSSIVMISLGSKSGYIIFDAITLAPENAKAIGSGELNLLEPITLFVVLELA